MQHVFIPVLLHLGTTVWSAVLFQDHVMQNRKNKRYCCYSLIVYHATAKTNHFSLTVAAKRWRSHTADLSFDSAFVFNSSSYSFYMHILFFYLLFIHVSVFSPIPPAKEFDVILWLFPSKFNRGRLCFGFGGWHGTIFVTCEPDTCHCFCAQTFLSSNVFAQRRLIKCLRPKSSLMMGLVLRKSHRLLFTIPTFSLKKKL